MFEVDPVSWTPICLSFGVHDVEEAPPLCAAPEQLAKEFEPSAQAIRNWVAQADRDEGRREDGLTTVEREELNRCGVRTASSSWSARSSQTGEDRVGVETDCRCTLPRR